MIIVCSIQMITINGRINQIPLLIKENSHNTLEDQIEILANPMNEQNNINNMTPEEIFIEITQLEEQIASLTAISNEKIKQNKQLQSKKFLMFSLMAVCLKGLLLIQPTNSLSDIQDDNLSLKLTHNIFNFCIIINFLASIVIH